MRVFGCFFSSLAKEENHLRFDMESEETFLQPEQAKGGSDASTEDPWEIRKKKQDLTRKMDEELRRLQASSLERGADFNNLENEIKNRYAEGTFIPISVSFTFFGE